MGQIKLGISLIMTTLFTFAIIMFAVNFGADNDASVLLSNDSDYITFTDNLSNDIQTFNENANASMDTLMSTTQETGDQSASSGGQFKVGITTLISMATTIITVGFVKIFGENEGFGVFLTAIIGILLWMIGLYAWKTWKGNPD